LFSFSLAHGTTTLLPWTLLLKRPFLSNFCKLTFRPCKLQLAAVPPVSTLAPALANSAHFVDLTSTNGAKHFKGATNPLNQLPFHFKDASDLQVFLDLVLKKSQVWGWNPIPHHTGGHWNRG
jgi:hypothetical protein